MTTDRGQDAAIAVLQQQVLDLQAQLHQLDQANSTLSGQNTDLGDQLLEVQAQLSASADVINAARHAARWWWAVCDDYPRLQAPWVGPLNLALRRLDKL